MADDPTFESVDELRKAAAASLGFGKADQLPPPGIALDDPGLVSPALINHGQINLGGDPGGADIVMPPSIAFGASPVGKDALDAADDTLGDIFKSML